MTRVSQALRVGEPERDDMDSSDTEDGGALLVSKESSDGCKCCSEIWKFAGTSTQCLIY